MRESKAAVAVEVAVVALCFDGGSDGAVVHLLEMQGRHEDATRLFFSKREVNRFNGEKLTELEKPVARVSAVHTGANARRASADTAEGLERDLYLAKGAKVMLTKNLYQQVGLVNGIRGEVVELVYADFRQGRHRLGAQGGLYGAYFRLSQ